MTATSVSPPETWSPPAPGRTDPLRRAAAFLLLAITLSWIPWLTLVATVGDPTATPWALGLWVLGGLGPAAAAMIVAAHGQGRHGLRLLLGSLRRWRLRRWWLVLLVPLPIAVVAVLAAVATGPAELDFAGLAQWYLLPAVFLWAVVIGGLEEIGWRGYLLPRLQDRVTALTASVAIGLVWGLWHAPLFLMDGTSQATMSFGWFTLQGVGLSVLLTWAYNSTRGSLLLAVLAHASITAWYTAAVRWIAPDTATTLLPFAAVTVAVAAAVVVWRHGPRDLAHRPRHRWDDHHAPGSSR